VDPEDIAEGVQGFVDPDQIAVLVGMLLDVDRTRLIPDRFAIDENDEARRLCNDTLRRLQAREVVPAGSLLLTGPDGGADPRRADVAVTETELMVLAADPRPADDELLRIPRSEITGVRLLDEHGGSIVQPATEVEELDRRDRRYIVWVDHAIGDRAGGHAFAFLAWSVAAEAERDFRRQLSPRNEIARRIDLNPPAW
jgi:hypothetical protein